MNTINYILIAHLNICFGFLGDRGGESSGRIQSKEACMRIRVPVVAFLLFALPVLAIAQVSPTKVVANISFDFHVGKDLLPAGSYSFSLGDKPGVIVIANAAAGKTIMATVLTRISQWPGNEASVVFDKMGDQYYLSELHAPGVDGFHFSGAPGPHSHTSVGGKK